MPRLRPDCGAALAALGLVLAGSPTATAQIAFVPGISSFSNGVTLSATPVVSYDRRYVRMTLNPQFTALEGFDSYSVPAAVSGLGSGGGGFRSVAVPGPTFSVGMDGLVPQGQTSSPSGYDPTASAFLSGSDGQPARPRLDGPVGPARAQASRRPKKATGHNAATLTRRRYGR